MKKYEVDVTWTVKLTRRMSFSADEPLDKVRMTAEMEAAYFNGLWFKEANKKYPGATGEGGKETIFSMGFGGYEADVIAIDGESV